MPSRYGLTFAKLRHLIAAADALNLTKAAEKLNISQPALSRSIISIERDYGFAIFDRHAAGLALTNTGKVVVAEARLVLERVRSYDHTLRLFGEGEEGKLAFGIAPQLASLVLSEVANDLMANGRKIYSRVLIRPSGVLIEALHNDEIEFCLLSDSQTSRKGLEVEKIWQISAGFFVRSGHPLLSYKKVTSEDLKKYPLCCAQELGLGPDFENHERMFICDNFNILKGITMFSESVLLCADPFAKGNQVGESLIPSKVSHISLISNPIFIVKADGRILSPVCNRTIGFCKQVIRRVFHEQ